MRIEQLSPFPYQEVRDEIERWPHAAVAWAQEEAMNYGAWQYVRPRLENTVRSVAGARDAPGARRATQQHAPPGELVTYVGRIPSAAPATGLVAVHERESQELLDAAFG